MVVVKKYVNILMQRSDWEYFYNRMEQLKDVYSNNVDFKNFIDSKIISSEHKINLILDCFDSNSKEFENFIKLLACNSRLHLIKFMSDEMRRQKYKMENICCATIYTKEMVSSEVLSCIENDLSKKFSVNIKLVNLLCKDNSVRVSLDDLGYEIFISSDYIKQQIKNFILKAI